MVGTLLIRWEKGYEKKLAAVTDLPPEQAKVAWYQMRFWIESEYKDHKRGELRWEQTKMIRASRTERLWLVMAVAIQCMVLVGGQLEAEEEQAVGKRQGIRRGRPVKPTRRPRGRELSCLVRGQEAILAAKPERRRRAYSQRGRRSLA